MEEKGILSLNSESSAVDKNNRGWVIKHGAADSHGQLQQEFSQRESTQTVPVRSCLSLRSESCSAVPLVAEQRN